MLGLSVIVPEGSAKLLNMDLGIREDTQMNLTWIYRLTQKVYTEKQTQITLNNIALKVQKKALLLENDFKSFFRKNAIAAYFYFPRVTESKQ